jgi:hypothetical protein
MVRVGWFSRRLIVVAFVPAGEVWPGRFRLDWVSVRWASCAEALSTTTTTAAAPAAAPAAAAPAVAVAVAVAVAGVTGIEDDGLGHRAR